jgi:hypothetical protein
MKKMTRLAIKKLNTSDDFLTPPELVEAMGRFDLDPCSSHRQTVPLASICYHYPEDNGLLLPWSGSVFVNPPFSELQAWVNRFILHGDGVMLVPARVEVSWFWKLWQNCEAIFFSKGPIKYICPEGNPPPRFFGGAFCAMGQQNAQRLRLIPLRGVLITSKEIRDLSI